LAETVTSRVSLGVTDVLDAPLLLVYSLSRQIWMNPSMLNSTELMIRSLYDILLRSPVQLDQVFVGDVLGRIWVAGKRPLSGYNFVSFINSTSYSSTGFYFCCFFLSVVVCLFFVFFVCLFFLLLLLILIFFALCDL
jgi:hypothetical protein